MKKKVYTFACSNRAHKRSIGNENRFRTHSNTSEACARRTLECKQNRFVKNLKKFVKLVCAFRTYE